MISIHALREEGDTVFRDSSTITKISIHALREEGDGKAWNVRDQTDTFLSTPSARRATRQRASEILFSRNFYPRPPRGGRPIDQQAEIDSYLISIHALREEGDIWVLSRLVSREISIHALREEGDAHFCDLTVGDSGFLSTPSARRATCALCAVVPADCISIHALREEGDSKNRDKISIFKQIVQHSARI